MHLSSARPTRSVGLLHVEVTLTDRHFNNTCFDLRLFFGHLRRLDVSMRTAFSRILTPRPFADTYKAICRHISVDPDEYPPDCFREAGLREMLERSCWILEDDAGLSTMPAFEEPEERSQLVGA